ncbi:hypothetical protein E6C67_08340 [Azospirillum sp. TSA2s]|uniref:hypothetical protein n=1 Tax=Azospirillum sp. TSA2s TaxID=709810 RepID=UPI0010AAD7ED|nr:hypothetical protein [Azospirillum sp. TSA2s]QCG93948.1 hypothetical protein E6C67_08340 [Azospirillum sp. TSA2s]
MQKIINSGRRSVSITANDENGPFTSYLYVNCTGSDASGLGNCTMVSAKHKSLAGATKWASKQLAA